MSRRLELQALADVQPRQVHWLVPGHVPLRVLTGVFGIGGTGKSTWLAGNAAEISSGRLGEPGDVVLISFEDTAAEVLRPRVEAAQGDLQRVHHLVDEGVAGIDPVRLPRDLAQLRELVMDVRARLVVVDPIVAAIEMNLDAHKDQDVRVLLGQLAGLAEEADCAIVLVGHLNKTPSTEAYIRVANSTAFWNACRSVVLITEDAEEPDSHRLVAQRKANYTRLSPVERHRIEQVVLPGTVDAVTGEPITTSRMTFVEFAEDVNGDDLLAPRKAGGAGKELLAVQLLMQMLGDGQWHDSAGVKKLAAAQGVSDRTIKRAAQGLEVEHDRRGFPSSTWWRLRQSGRPLSRTDGLTVTPLHESHNHAGLPVTPVPVGPVGPRGIGDGLTGLPTEGFWLGRDGRWRSVTEEPPRWPAEVMETAAEPPDAAAQVELF
jgi:hypothetical protein